MSASLTPWFRRITNPYFSYAAPRALSSVTAVERRNRGRGRGGVGRSSLERTPAARSEARGARDSAGRGTGGGRGDAPRRTRRSRYRTARCPRWAPRRRCPRPWSPRGWCAPRLLRQRFQKRAESRQKACVLDGVWGLVEGLLVQGLKVPDPPSSGLSDIAVRPGYAGPEKVLDKPSTPGRPSPAHTHARLFQCQKPRRCTLRWRRARPLQPPSRGPASSAPPLGRPASPAQSRSRPAADRRTALLGAAPRWCPARRLSS